MVKNHLHTVLRGRAEKANRTMRAEADALAREANAAAAALGVALKRPITGRQVYSYAFGQNAPKYPTARALAHVSGLSLDAVLSGTTSAAA